MIPAPSGKRVNMKLSKGISSKFYDFRSEVSKYRLRPSKSLRNSRPFFISHFSSSLVKFKFPERGTREDFLYDGTFHEAVGCILVVAQLFGIMPVRGVRDKSPKNLKFKKFSIRFVLAILLILSLVWITVIDAIWIFRTTMEFAKLINFIFDFTNLLSFLCFLELARKWPRLMMRWHEVEKFLPQLKYQMDKQKMAYEIKMVSLLILSISMGSIRISKISMNLTSLTISAEHLLSITVGAHGANNCPSIRDPIRAYYISNYPQVFLIFPYSGALGTFTKFLNIIATFAWSYTDLFVIVISIGLASKFRQINADLREVKGRSVHPGFWAEYRLYYRELSSLVSLVDRSLSKIILISVSNNLFFICVQLLRSLE